MQHSVSLDWLVGTYRLTGHITEITTSASHHSLYFGADAETVSQIRKTDLFCSGLALRYRPLRPDYGIILLLSQ